MKKIIMNVASIPSRETCLRQVIASIINQCNKVNVFLNNYTHKPKFLDHPKISCFQEKDRGDVGKFYKVEEEAGYYFTIDDDIIYPSNYVSRMIDSINHYNNKAAIGVHGYVWRQPIRNIYKDRILTHYREPLDVFRNVQVIGTGTLAFDTTSIKLQLSDFLKPNMADVWFALAAQRQHVPLYLLPRPKRWLTDIPEALQTSSIYQNSKNKSHGQYQTDIINQYKEWKLYV